MSNITTYKATFKSPKCKYLKYFCEFAASEWTFKKFKKHFQQLKDQQKQCYKNQLKVVKNHSKDIPAEVLEHIEKELECIDGKKVAPPAPTFAPKVQHLENIYNVKELHGNFIVNHNQGPSKKKNKRDEQKSTSESFWDGLINNEYDQTLNKYSPLRNGVIRTALPLKPRPVMGSDNSDINIFINTLKNNAMVDLETNIEDTANIKEHLDECRFIKNIFTVMLNVNKKMPPMSYSESVFNQSLVHPCLYATATLAQSSSSMKPYYVPGEEPLNAMNKQLRIIGAKVDKRKVYLADGVVRLQELNDLEVLLLETSGSYQNKDERKISFDNIKGMFALLGMMKTVADQYSHASVESFQKLKLYYIQASDEYLRLWSIKYISNGIYAFERVDKMIIHENLNQLDTMLSPLLDFFYQVKNCLMETCTVLEELKDEDEENSSSSSQQEVLSDLICPQVFRLSYNKDGKGFAKLAYSSPQYDL